MKSHIKIAVIGAGNMGGAVARGLAASGAVSPHDVTLTSGHAESLAKFAGEGFELGTDNALAAKGADVVFIAVKPFAVPAVLSEIGTVLNPAAQIVVNIAAGIKPETYTEALPEGMPVVFMIPNTPIEICEGMTFLSPVSSATDTVMDTLVALLSGTGAVEVVPLEKLGIGMVLASCGVAYADAYIEAAARGGEALGYDYASALDIVCRTVKGASALMLAHGDGPAAEIRRVATPGGFTERGLKAMSEAGFEDSVRTGLKPE